MYQLEKWQYSRWQKDTRFYSLELCQDIFGNWIIKRTWGGNGGHEVRRLVTPSRNSRRGKAAITDGRYKRLGNHRRHALL